jgi:vacuolar iron transporter family protein
LYEAKGLSAATARRVAEELTATDAFGAHADAELHIDPYGLTNPWQAAGASAVAFTAGSALPLLAILLPPAGIRVAVTFVAVVLALAGTGWVSARLGGAGRWRAVTRLVTGGVVAMVVTFAIGAVVGSTAG